MGFDHKPPHSEPSFHRFVLAPPGRCEGGLNRRRQVVRLSLREYLPLVMTVALWAVIVAEVGAADAVRLLAATVMLRAVQMLTRMSTAAPLKARVAAPVEIRRQARRMAIAVQASVLLANVALIAAFVAALGAIGQEEVAAFLPLVAIGLPARLMRYSDARTDSPYFRLALAAGGLATALLGWAAGLGAVGMGLAFGARDWVAYAVIRWWPRLPHIPQYPSIEPLTLAEVARNTAISGRRLLTYRLTKVALTVFGPLGNFAARTGRGLNWHARIEPYLPHNFLGFILFALGAFGGAGVLAVRAGQPVALVAAAGLLQLGAVATNIALMWRWLPDRHDPGLVIEEDEDD